jgi:thiopurine S-methyltransferase
MELDFWHTRWNQNEIGFHQAEINFHLQEYWPPLGLTPGTDVFVPLCGKSQDMWWLCQQGYNVFGIEISPIAVQAFFAEHDLHPSAHQRDNGILWVQDNLRILCGDIFDLQPSDLAQTAAIYDRASLIALPPDLRQRYVEQLDAILPRSIQGLLVTLEYPAGELTGPPFSVPDTEVRALYEPVFSVQCCSEVDVLAENPRFRDKGATALVEKVFHISRPRSV